MKDKLKMHNTTHPLHPQNLAPHQGLVMMRVQGTASVTFKLFGEEEPFTNTPSDKSGGKVTYVPRVSGPPDSIQPTTVSFSEWWNEIVIKDRLSVVFSRKDLILAMANQVGGAHVDPQLDEQYARLTRFHSQGWRVQVNGEIRPPDNSLVAASIRQIAHELLVSINNSLPHIGAEGNK